MLEVDAIAEDALESVDATDEDDPSAAGRRTSDEDEEEREAEVEDGTAEEDGTDEDDERTGGRDAGGLVVVVPSPRWPPELSDSSPSEDADDDATLEAGCGGPAVIWKVVL